MPITAQPSPTVVAVSAEVRQRTFLIVPAHNEARCLAEVLAELVTAYPHVVVVDDGSTDDTYAIARRCAPHALRHLINRGQGAALQTGIEFALRQGAEYIVTFDADGQHRVEDIAALVAPIAAGQCDITLGSRFLGETGHIPLTRRVLLRLAVFFTRIMSRMPLTDAHNGLRGFSRRAAAELDISMDRMAHASEIIDSIRRSRLPFREVPVHVRYTAYSLSKGQSWRDAARVAFQYLLGRVSR